MNVNFSLHVDDPYGTRIQSFGDCRTWKWEDERVEHVLLKPMKLTEPDSEHCTKPRKPWDGSSICFKAIPRDQVGEQSDPRENAEEVREYSFPSSCWLPFLITTKCVVIVIFVIFF